MDYPLYSVLHLFAAILLFTALGGLALRQVEAAAPATGRAKKLAGAAHGLALLLLLVTGLGLIVHLTRSQVIQGFPWPLWVWLKLLLWLFFGSATVLLKKLPGKAVWLWWGLPILGGLTAYLCVYKPWG